MAKELLKWLGALVGVPVALVLRAKLAPQPLGDRCVLRGDVTGLAGVGFEIEESARLGVHVREQTPAPVADRVEAVRLPVEIAATVAVRGGIQLGARQQWHEAAALEGVGFPRDFHQLEYGGHDVDGADEVGDPAGRPGVTGDPHQQRDAEQLL